MLDPEIRAYMAQIGRKGGLMKRITQKYLPPELKSDIESRGPISRQRRDQLINKTVHKARQSTTNKIKNGIIPRAKELLCHDCGTQAHEYDHCLGYEGDNRHKIQPVCRVCHPARHKQRRVDITNGL